MRLLAKTILLSAIMLLAYGCGGKLEDGMYSAGKFFNSFSDPHPGDLAKYAFDPAADPDLRRKSVVLLSGHDWGVTETYLDGYDAILRSEMRKRPAETQDTGLMSATIVALGKGRNPKYIDTLLLALKLAASPQVRWDAALALDSVIGEKAITQLCGSSDQTNEPSVDVRVACCRAMRHYRRQDVVDNLINRLSVEEEFAVRYAARKSLVELCKTDFGPDYTDWVGTKLGKLETPEAEEGKKKSMWNPLNWF